MATTLPPIIAFPPAEVRKTIPETDWRDCIQSWTFLSHAYLALPIEIFDKALSSVQENSVLFFLKTYLSAMARADTDNNYLHASAATDLHRSVFLISHRLISESNHTVTTLLDWKFLADLSRVYKRNSNLIPLVEHAWATHEQDMIKSLNYDYLSNLLSEFEGGDTSVVTQDETFSLRLLPLLRACPSAGTYLLTVSDFFDAAVSAYATASPNSRARLLILVYICLLAPLQTGKPNQSLLTDHLYGLKSATKSTSNPLLPDLISNTPFIHQTRKLLKSRSEPRAASLITSLEAFRTSKTLRPKTHSHRKIDKGKARSNENGLHTAVNGIHVHRMSLVTQIQDLFPDLGSGFVVKLLDEYADDIETVTSHLLENSLPPHLRSLDRSEELPSQFSISNTINKDIAPRSTLSPPAEPFEAAPSITTSVSLPVRHNIHDNDDFDNLRISTSQLYFGRREDQADTDPSSRAASKAAILAALAAFDADDDERDDTYDLADVGGTVDAAATGPAEEKEESRLSDDSEGVLLTAFKATPEVFGRDATTRRGAARRALRAQTGLTDESIEGWSVMVRRDPRRLRRLEARFELGVGDGSGALQRELAKTAWQAGGATTTDEEGDGDASSGGEVARGRRERGGAKGGMGGRGGRGAQGGVAGASGDATTQRSRERKEAGKGSRANHNRRDQRARKMARGGLPG